MKAKEAPDASATVQKLVAAQHARDRHLPIDLRTLYQESAKAHPGLTVAQFHDQLEALRQAGKVRLLPVTRPEAEGGLRNSEYAMPLRDPGGSVPRNKHGEPYEVFGYAAPPEEKQAGGLDEELRKGWQYQARFLANKENGGYVPLSELYERVKRDRPGLTVEEFHRELDRLRGEGKLEAGIANTSVHTATPEQKALWLRAGDQAGKMIDSVRFK